MLQFLTQIVELISILKILINSLYQMSVLRTIPDRICLFSFQKFKTYRECFKLVCFYPCLMSQTVNVTLIKNSVPAAALQLIEVYKTMIEGSVRQQNNVKCFYTKFNMNNIHELLKYLRGRYISYIPFFT